MYAGGWDAPFTRTSTHRAQDFIEDSRAIERFIKQKKTSVCRLGTRGKSGKRAGCACHKSGPTPSPNPLQRLRLPYKEYLPSSPRNLEKTGLRLGSESAPGDAPGLGGLEFLQGIRALVGPAPTGGLLT